MTPPSARFRHGPAAIAAAALLAVSCGDTTDPNGMTLGRLAVAPVFGSAGTATIEIREVRFLLRRTTDASVARDTTIQVPPGADSVELEVTVPLVVQDETFELLLELRDSTGAVVFAGGPITVTPTTGGTPPVVQVPIQYVGVGADAASVEITSTASLLSGQSAVLTAVARDSGGTVIPGTPILWRTLDSAQATVPAADSGRVVAGGARGTARIVAELFTGPADTAGVDVQPLPTSIVADSGAGAAGTVGQLVGQPLVARLLADDGLGVSGVQVQFQVTGGTGTLSADSAATDTAGRARTTVTLGQTAGAVTIEASSTPVPGTASFGLTAQPGVPAALVFTVSPNDVLINATLTPAPQVEVHDQFGNLVTSATTAVTLAIGANPGGGTLSGPTTVNAGAGTATFTGLGIDQGGPGYTLVATATGLTPDTSAAFEVVAASRTASWINAAGGNWSDSANWDVGAPPRATDTAVIDLAGTYNVTLDIDATVIHLVVGGSSGVQTLAVGTGRTLTVDSSTVVAAPGGTGVLSLSGNLTGAGGLSVDGQLQWLDGTISGTGAFLVQATGSMVMSSPATKILSERSLQNNGVVLWNDGPWELANGAAIGNLAGGLVDVQNDVSITSGFGPVTNSGLWQKSGGAGVSQTTADFLNLGTVSVISGTVELTPTGSYTHTGTFTVAPGTTIEIPGGSHTLDSSVTGGGTLAISAGSVTLNGTVAMPALTALGGTTTINGVLQNVSTLTVNGAQVILATGAQDSIARVILSGTLRGTDTLVVLDSLHWEGGIMRDAGLTRIVDTAVAVLATTVTKTLDGRTVQNAGTLRWLDGDWSFRNAATLVNEATGTMDLRANATLTQDLTNPTVTNAGAVVRDTGTDTLWISARFDHSGTLDVQTGLFRLGFGGTISTGVTVSAGATLWFAGGTFDLADGFTATGNGTVLSSAQLQNTAGQTATLTRFHMNGGFLTGAGTFTVTDSLEWTAGTLDGTGLLQTLDTVPFVYSGTASRGIQTRTLRNAGPLTWIGTGTLSLHTGATVENLASGSMDLQSDATIQQVTQPVANVTNTGSLTRSTSAGTFTINARFSNNGSANVQTGVLALSDTATITHPGSFTGAAAGALRFSGGNHTLNGPVTGLGRIEGSCGDVTFANTTSADTIRVSCSASDFVANGAITSLDVLWVSAGTFALNQPATVAFFRQNNGTFSGTANLTVADTLRWINGTWAGTGQTIILDTVTAFFDGTVSNTLDGRTVQNAGTVLWDQGPMTIQGGATFNNQATGSVLVGSVFARPTFMLNTGAGGGTFQNTGTLSLTQDTALVIAAPVVNDGILDVTIGRMAFTGNLTHNTGSAMQGRGDLDLSAATIVGGTLLGDVRPGTSPGILTITGPFPQGAAAPLIIEIDGTAPGTQYDRLSVSGAVTAGGLLTIASSVLPTPGDSFQALTFGSRTGQFTAVSNLDLWPVFGEGMAYDTVWTGASLNLLADRQIVFSADSFGVSQDRVLDGLFRVNARGGVRVNVTPEGEFMNTYARWSPDGTRVTYTANNLLHVATVEPSADLNGGVAHLVNDSLTRRGRYSPDGIHLAAECGQFLTRVCTIADVTGTIPSLDNIGDGAGKVIVTNAVNASLGGPGSFVWDPLNADRMAVVRDTVIAGALTSRIYTVNFDGTGVATVGTLPVARRVEGTIDWSPDGTLLAMAVRNDTTSAREIWTMDMGTGAIDTVSAPPANHLDAYPVFSPDGSEILFARNDTFGCEITYVIASVAGVERVEIPTTLSCEDSDAVAHDWSPSGGRIVLVDNNAGGSVAVFTVPASVTAATYLSVRTAAARSASATSFRDIHPSWRP